MKNLPIAFLLLCFLLATKSSRAQSMGQGYTTAVGVKGYFSDGSIGGINVRHYLKNANALEGSLLLKHNLVELEGIYEWQNNITGAQGLRWYVGPGAVLGFTSGTADNSTIFGLKGTIGLDYKFTGAPINIAFDIDPTFVLAPNTDFNLNAGL